MALKIVRPYTRVSMEEQKENFSLPAQKEAIVDYATRHRFNIAAWYSDEGISAKNMSGRPDFQRLLRESSKGDTILVYKLDRMTRSSKDLEYLLELSEKGVIYFESVTEACDTSTAAGRMFVRQLIQFAQFEREMIGERSKVGKRKRMTSGIWTGGIAPFGYKFVPSGEVRKRRALNKLVPDEERRHIVPMIFDKYLSGVGIRKVAEWLNRDLGVRTPRGRVFSANAVKVILTNPTYCGDVPIDVKKGRLSRVQGTHEALISRELFDAVQATMERRKTLPPRHATGVYPIAGIARCGICGGTICAGRNRRDPKTGEKKWRHYRCSNHLRGRGCGDKPWYSISAPIIEEALVQRISALITSTESFEVFFQSCVREANEQTGAAEAEIARLKTDLLDVEARINRWKEAYEAPKDPMPYVEYVETTKPLKERKQALLDELAKKEAERVAVPSQAELYAVFSSFAEAWGGFEDEPEQRKALVAEFVEIANVDIIVFPDRRVELRSRPIRRLRAV